MSGLTQGRALALAGGGWLRYTGGAGLAGTIARRIAAGLLALLATTLLVFLAINVLPGDVAMVVLGPDSTPATLAALRTELGLDAPLLQRYVSHLGAMASGDFGLSSVWLARGQHMPVWTLIQTPLANSAWLVLLTIVVFVPLSVAAGTYTALHAGRAPDHVISFSALTISALPDFLTGTLLVLVFFAWLDLLPPTVSIGPGESPLDHPLALILPIATLSAGCLAFASRLIRASVLEVLDRPYVAWARIYEVRPWRFVTRYILRNALAPGIQGLALVIRSLVGGLIIAESLFNYPGIGSQLAAAVMERDVQMVSVITTLLAAVYIAVNLLADVAVIALNPRVRGGNR